MTPWLRRARRREELPCHLPANSSAGPPGILGWQTGSVPVVCNEQRRREPRGVKGRRGERRSAFITMYRGDGYDWRVTLNWSPRGKKLCWLNQEWKGILHFPCCSCHNQYHRVRHATRKTKTGINSVTCLEPAEIKVCSFKGNLKDKACVILSSNWFIWQTNLSKETDKSIKAKWLLAFAALVVCCSTFLSRSTWAPILADWLSTFIHHFWQLTLLRNGRLPGTSSSCVEGASERKAHCHP